MSQEKPYKKDREKERLEYRRKQKEWRENGLCTKCGREREPGHLLCATCRQQQREGYHKRKARQNGAGLCVRCGKPLDIPYKTQCRACRKKASVYYMTKVVPRKMDGGDAA